MENVYLIVTSIAHQEHPVLKQLSKDSLHCGICFVLIGDAKSPSEFNLPGCNYYSLERQAALPFELAKILPVGHYARKNLGYLIAASKGAEIIIETDDDNYPLESFWNTRSRQVHAPVLRNKNWVNVYKYFTEKNIWPRGFALQNIHDTVPHLQDPEVLYSPIHQGLADENPDVDAIYRLTMPLPIVFNKNASIALGSHSMCPFNSQNTTWFKEAFALLYLPSYCSFRMTDIWRSFVAQRIAWTCAWPVVFHQSTVRQERNNHNLLDDFRDEIVGYTNNAHIMKSLTDLDLKQGVESIADNMLRCYSRLVDLELVGESEIPLLRAWLNDICANAPTLVDVEK